MNDHQDSEHFSYNTTWAQIEDMLDKAERKQNQHFLQMQKKRNTEESTYFSYA